MQQWVLETGQSAIQSRKGQRYLRGEDYVMRVKVESAAGQGPYVAKARAAVTGETVNVILAGSGTGAASDTGTDEVSQGSSIGVREPSWSIELEGERYEVAVDWKVFSS